jgi:tRNA(His) 5'-end guanylyltransferase
VSFLAHFSVISGLDGGTDEELCRLSAKYHFEKPNDKRGLDLMNEAAAAVMNELPDLVLAYGLSDEYR